MKFTLIASTLALAGQTAKVEDKQSENQTVCRALAMSGGGSRGAYEAGVLYGMYHTLNDKSDMEYDVVSGVSAGSINTLFAATFPKG